MLLPLPNAGPPIAPPPAGISGPTTPRPPPIG